MRTPSPGDAPAPARPAPDPGFAGAAAPLRPWREVVAPRAEVSSGRCLQADFAVDLAQVRAGRAAPEYGEPGEFFARTYLTEGTRRLLAAALRRVAGRGGEPVVQVRTAFGGGKTHAMLALFHLLGGARAPDPLGPTALPELASLLSAAGLATVPAAATAILSGTDLSPARPWPSPALRGRPVGTLWGELAAQLGGEAAYQRLAEEDRRAAPPGAAALAELLDAHGPCVILIDELVPFLRVLYGRRAALPAGSFDANLTFVHSLTEAARRSRAAMVVASIPESELEMGGRGGQAAAARLGATFGRLEAVWRPVQPHEAIAVVQRRLFEPPGEAGARAAAATCRAFARMYAARPGAFPPQARAAAYAQRLAAAYPIHPELFDRLHEEWARLESFQGTRGILRLLSAAVCELWRRGDTAPLILPGGLPLEAPGVRDRLTRCLPEGWDAVVAAGVDGPASEPAAIEREVRRLGRHRAARRLARTIFLGSAAPPPAGSPRGVEAVRLRLGAVHPGEPPALFDDALAHLRERLSHLYSDGDRCWYEARPNLRRTAADRAAGLEDHAAQDEVRRCVQGWIRDRDRAATGAFHGLHAVGGPGDIPDDPVARLAILPVGDPHTPGAGDASAAVARAAGLLAARTRHTNMLIALAADGAEAGAALAAARAHLAWQSIQADGEGGRLELDTQRRREVADGLRRAAQTLEHRLRQAYRWLLVPTQDGAGPVRWEAIRVAGDGDPLVDAARRLQGDHLLRTGCSPAELRLELDRWLWPGAPDIEVAQLWRHLTKYLYLPRFSDRDALARTIAEGVASGEHFAYADGRDPDGAYTGLRFGVPGLRVQVDGAARLVKAEVARAQLQAPAGGAAGAAGSAGGPPGGAARSDPPTRFAGTVCLDPRRVGADAARIAEEVLRHLAELPGAGGRVILDIEVHVPEGVPEDVVRVVRENARALRFRSAEFDR